MIRRWASVLALLLSGNVLAAENAERNCHPDPDLQLEPLVRVAPEQPMRASWSGTIEEGYVILRFDVTPDGRVEDPEVVESSGNIFERSALRSIIRWRYAPQTDGDGNPVTACDQTARIDFHWEW